VLSEVANYRGWPTSRGLDLSSYSELSELNLVQRYIALD
jgi:hypothetical protein